MKDYIMFLASICLLTSLVATGVFALGPSNVEVIFEEEDEGPDVAFPTGIKNPFRCTVSANDRESCVLLKHCVWCQGEGLPGICVSEKQEKALIHKIPHVKCFEEDGDEQQHDHSYRDAAATTLLRKREKASSTENKHAPVSSEKISAPYDPKCLNAPSQDGEDDPRETCDATTDSQGEMCIWCDAAGVFQLCLSNEQARHASSYLQCDMGAATMDASVGRDQMKREDLVLPKARSVNRKKAALQLHTLLLT